MATKAQRKAALDRMRKARENRKAPENAGPIIVKYAGLTVEDIENFSLDLELDHNFKENTNAMAKGQALVAQVQSQAKPTCVFAGWESGKAMITGTLPADVEVPEHWVQV